MVVTIALRGYEPLTVACARTTLGAVALLVLMRVLNRPLPVFSARMIKYLVFTGILNTALPFFLLSWGQQYVPSAFAGLSMAALPLFVLPLAHIFTDEKLTTRNVVGVCLGFAGAAILIGPGVLRLGIGSEPLGQLACLTAALSYAISSIATRRFPPIDPITLSALLLVVGALVLIPAMLVFEGVPTVSSVTESTYAIIFLGLFPTALAAMIRVVTIRTAGSVFMTLVNYQVPVWSMIFGAWILSEALPLRFFLALVIILCGMGISQWTSLRQIFSRNTKG